MDYPFTVFGVAAHYTGIIEDGRTDFDVFDHLKSEVDELRIEIQNDDPDDAGVDGIEGEAIDIIACCVDLIRRANPTLTIEQLESLMAAYMQKKCEKWKAKAEAGEYAYQQR